ncbi:hypothetical protein OG21DRAFT_1490436 [Imleria badia]|nr:hypothetical protein OG21DRAFT_1490436 [Imleria badia]
MDPISKSFEVELVVENEDGKKLFILEPEVAAGMEQFLRAVDRHSDRTVEMQVERTLIDLQVPNRIGNSSMLESGVTKKATSVWSSPNKTFEQQKEIIQSFPASSLTEIVSPMSQYTTIAPLALVLFAPAFKAVQEDFKQNQSDSELNARVAKVLAPSSTFEQPKWKHIRVGDIVRLESDEFIPADIRTAVEKQVNVQIIFLFVFLLALSVGSLLVQASIQYVVREPLTALVLASDHQFLSSSQWSSSNQTRFRAEPRRLQNAPSDLVSSTHTNPITTDILTFIILYNNNNIPISLIVTMDVVKFQQSAVINSDLDMYYARTDTPILCHTSSLIEELGQIELIFSSKTGTLVRNEMEFKSASIGGVVHAEEVDKGRKASTYRGEEGVRESWRTFDGLRQLLEGMGASPLTKVQESVRASEVEARQLGAMQDLVQAIVLIQKTLYLRPRGHPDRSMSLSNLAFCLSTWYEQLGTMQHLNSAIAVGREALHLRPPGHPPNIVEPCEWSLHSAAAMQDIEEAILLDQEALALCPQGHPGRSMSLHNLAGQLSLRYQPLGAMQDLDEAIALDREALDLCTQGNPLRSSSLNNFASCLYARYKGLGEMRDLEEAIIFHREALTLLPQGHIYRSTSSNNLASSLFSRYEQLGAIQDIEAAVVLSRESLAHWQAARGNAGSRRPLPLAEKRSTFALKGTLTGRDH